MPRKAWNKEYEGEPSSEQPKLQQRKKGRSRSEIGRPFAVESEFPNAGYNSDVIVDN